MLLSAVTLDKRPRVFTYLVRGPTTAHELSAILHPIPSIIMSGEADAHELVKEAEKACVARLARVPGANWGARARAVAACACRSAAVRGSARCGSAAGRVRRRGARGRAPPAHPGRAIRAVRQRAAR